jgi:DNA polymerase-3 subunit alpha
VLACTLLGGKSYGAQLLHYDDEQYRRAIGVVEWYQAIFGDRYYLEVQRFPALRRTCALNQAYELISRDTGVALAATSDCHYVHDGDSEMQKILHAAHRGSSVSQTEAAWEYNIKLSIPESDERVYQDLLGTGLSKYAAGQALSNTGVIADRCDVKLQKVEPIHYPIEGRDWIPWV